MNKRTDIVAHDGDTWRVLSTGVIRDDGKVFAHLASTTRGKRQRNGFMPMQINDWIDPPPARVLTELEGQLLAALGKWDKFMRDNYDRDDCPEMWDATAEAIAAAAVPAFDLAEDLRIQNDPREAIEARAAAQARVQAFLEKRDATLPPPDAQQLIDSHRTGHHALQELAS